MALARTTLGEFRGRWLQARLGVQAVYRSSGDLARFKVCIVDRQGSNLCDRYPVMNDMADAMQIRGGTFFGVDCIVIGFADVVVGLPGIKERDVQGRCRYEDKQQQYF